jgi:hypothetical protein
VWRHVMADDAGSEDHLLHPEIADAWYPSTRGGRGIVCCL